MILVAVGLIVMGAAYFSRDDQPDDAKVSAESEASAEQEDGSLFSGHIQAIEKATGVQDNISSAFEKRNAQMDAQGQ